MAPAQPPDPADPLLAQITAQVLQQVAQLPDCTCLETLTRHHRPPGDPGPVRPLDTVRLEVLYLDGKELFSSPGETRWERNPAAFTAAGMIGNGIFALYLRVVFATGDAEFRKRGTELVEGRQAWRYDFQVPRLVSGQTLTVVGGKGSVGLKGSFWADVASLDLVRLELHADDIPADLPVFDFTVKLVYARVAIAERQVLLPQSGEVRLALTTGREDRDFLEFTHCQSFRAETSMVFEAPPPLVANPPPAAFTSTVVGQPLAMSNLPVGLRLAVTLTTPVQADTPVGAALQGRVAGAVRLQGKPLVPDGALVHGRLRRLDRFSDASGDYWIVGVEFIEIELPGVRFRFIADLEDVQAAGLEWQWSTSNTSVQRGRRRSVTTTQSTYLPDLPGVGAFFVRGTQFVLPAGARLIWKTRDLDR